MKNYLFRLSSHTYIKAISALALLMYIGRIGITHHYYYGFLVWNLFLAYIPYQVMRSFASRDAWAWQCLKILVWFFFLPNSFYLTTDFIHLRHTNDIPFAYDVLLLSAFSFAGLLMGWHSLCALDLRFRHPLYLRHRQFLVMLVCLATGYGIYLGRIERFNSWDIMTQPHELLMTFLVDLRHPIRNLDVWLVTLLYGLIAWAGFQLLRKAKTPSMMTTG